MGLFYPLELFVNWLVYSVFNLSSKTLFGEAINFFIYDSIKIILLLFFMIFLLGFLRTYIPHEKVKDWLSKQKRGVGNLMASCFGAVTPFCSCSSIPIFLSFLESGIPLGITFSFLITSPLVNEYLVILMLGFFGWKITLIYVLFGILLGVFSGLILGKMKLEKYLVKDLISPTKKVEEKRYNDLKERLDYGYTESSSMVKKLWIWILIGVGLGAIIHNYIPSELIQGLIAKGGIFSVPIAVLLGVQIYANCVAIIPIAIVLFEKGLPLGTALAFMMATSALSLPEAIILRRAMKLKLIAIFFGVTTLGIILIGYLFNFLQKLIM